MIVIHPPVESRRETLIREAAAPLPIVNARNEAEAIEAMPQATGFFGKLTPELLAAATQLRWVQAPTASLEHYLFPALVDHPCVLTNMRGLFGDVIADHVFGYILCFARNFPTYWRYQQEHRWEPVGGEAARTSYLTGPGVVSAIDLAHQHLSDLTIGIVGLGQIGGEIARRARAFGMEVVAVDPLVRSASADVSQVWPVSELPRLLNVSDYVVIAAPHTPETVGLFGPAQFEAMKRTAFLINIGRGVLVRLDALVDALQRRAIAGAAIDVAEQEPLPASHPLWECPNVLITPHVAAASPRIAERHLAVLLDNLRRFATDQPLRNVVDKSKWF